MEKHPLYGKKKKKVTPIPNPLFCQWLQEWRDDAVEKGWKSQYIFGKALYSLKKYPLPLSTGIECKMLDNFGDKICKMLDDKLAKYIQEQYGSIKPNSSLPSTSAHQSLPRKDGQPKKCQPSTHAISDSDSDSGTTSKLQAVQNQSGRLLTTSASTYVADGGRKRQQTISQFSTHAISDSDSDCEPQATQPKRRRKSSCGRDYIPAVGSGAYALLLTLYRNMQNPDGRGFMSKLELTREAQTLADKSFNIPDPGCRYTAWSSMGTLIKKNLVIKENSPAKYSLTDAGCEIAHKLQTVQQGGTGINLDTRPARLPPLPGMPADMSSDSLPPPGLTNQETTNLRSSSFRFHYVKDDGLLVTVKDQAAVLIDEELSIGFLIKCKYSDLLESGKRYKLDTSRPLGEDVYAYLHNDDAEDTANTAGCIEESLPSESILNLNNQKKAKPMPPKRNNGKPDASKRKPKERQKANNKITESQQLLPLIDGLGVPASILHPKQHLTSSGYSQDSSQESIKSHSSVTSTKSLSSVSSFDSQPPSFILYPSQFDIVLCVDNCEFYGSSKSTSKTLLPDLLKNGVDTDLRKLHVGDLLWIAREKTRAVPGQLAKPQGRELVLDYIIERKRMDDYVHSCIDGRLQEQKFRLKHCGLRHPIYLVEDYGSSQHFSISEDKIKQSITNTQVIDGFQVKKTKDTKETVAYLTIMTRYLQSLYRHKTLYACSADEIRRSSEVKSIDDSEERLIPFEEFNQSSVKNKDLTASELFGKQLIQLYGMSAERAKAVIEVYPTLSNLISAYDSCSTEKERENMLSSIKCGKSGRGLGMVQSRMIYQLYCTEGALC
ncbi:hypothetical protein ScPMuIL_013732 [Solemya velum]